jgi:hypothetical protein
VGDGLADDSVAGEAALEISASATPSTAAKTVSESKLGESSISWLVTLAAIGLPVFVLVVWYSIQSADLSWHRLDTSIERGDFLVPVLILCVESLRRWWTLGPRERTRRIRLKVGQHTVAMEHVRRTALTACVIGALLTFVATIYAASQPLTPKSGDSIVVITTACFAVAFSFGTMVIRFSGVKERGQ